MGFFDNNTKKAPEEDGNNAEESIIASLKEQVAKLTAQNNVLAGQNNAYAYTSQDQREKIAKLQEQLAKYTSLEDGEVPQEIEDSAHEQRIAELQSQIAALEKEKQEALTKCSAAEKQVAKLRDICTRAVNMGNGYKSSFEKLSSEHKGTLGELAALKKSGAAAKSQGTTALEAELAGMKAQKDALVAKSGELESKIEGLEAQVDELQEAIDVRDEQISALNKQVAESQTLYSELKKDKDASDRELKTAKMTGERLNRELSTNKELLDNMTAERDKSVVEVDRLKKIVEAYKKQLKSVKELLAGGLPDLG